MRWRFWQRRRSYDFAAEMRGIYRSMELPKYTDLDRERDFKAVFGGPAGQRVLYQLMNWGRFLSPSPADTNLLMHIEGRRYLIYQILAIVHGVPAEPMAANEEDEEKDHVSTY